jgi:dTDP-glucose pyrophosphorylase
MLPVERKRLLDQVIIPPEMPIAEAIAVLDRAGVGILLLCEDDRRLIGVLTDGDVRRAILRGMSLESPCVAIAGLNPVVAPAGASPREVLHLMDHGREFVVNHLPVVDEEGRVVDLLLRRDLISEEQASLSAVIMAGGAGTRLWPLTEDTPKPMLPVGDRPLMELIIEQLRQAGIHRVNVTMHYQSDKISSHFGDGRAFGVELNYVTEDRPLGTAGALGLLEAPDEPLLVINGDILTRVDFRAMLAYHRKHGADLTVGVRQYDLKVPYGVVECEGPHVRQVREKPQIRFLVNAGIYLLEPAVHQYIPSGQHLDMTDLIQRLLENGRPVVSFPIVEYWLDIGQYEDYRQAQEDVKSGRFPH